MLGHLIKTSFLLVCVSGVIQAAPTDRRDSTDPISIVKQAEATYQANTVALLQRSNTACTQSNLSLRRAWDDLSRDERVNYINAVQCMYCLPSQTPPSLAPGAQNRLDDFNFAHIMESNFIHVSALLLPWHRQFMWSWEQTLRSECNYTGTLPYWAWERHSADQTQSPVFQPGPDSFGTNGLLVPNKPAIQAMYSVDITPQLTFTRDTGTGGGCITDGAFVNLTSHLGPVLQSNPANDTYGTAYNPRCITRDLNSMTPSQNLTYTTIANLYATSSIHEFHPLLEATAHPNSHQYIGGSSSDFYASPNEPLFYLIHAQIDRLWTVWQMQDWEGRKDGLDGTVTIGNIPPSENATLDTVMRMRTAGGDVRIGDVMSPTAGQFCYMYV